MSATIFLDDVKFFQRLLRVDGLYDGVLDGKWGPLTEKGAVEFERHTDAIRDEFGAFDVRSEKNIRTLSLRAQSEARRCLRRVQDAGYEARIISGTRTYAEQDKLFQQGRLGNLGPIVTKAEGGHSNHNFGIAWDIGIFSVDGIYVTDAKRYREAADAGKGDRVEWGGDWKTFPDAPHYQLKLAVTLADLRERFEAGRGHTAFVQQNRYFSMNTASIDWNGKSPS